MKKYIFAILPVFAFAVGFFVLNINPIDATRQGCTADSNYSVIDGGYCGDSPYYGGSSSPLLSCSTIYSGSLVRGQSCSALIDIPAKFSFKAKDPDSDNLSWTINWGDGTQDSTPCPSSNPFTTFSKSHTWGDSKTYNVSMEVSDCKGGTDKTSFNVIVDPPISSSSGNPPGDKILPNISDNNTSIEQVANPSADLTDIVMLPQDWPDKVLWKNAIYFPKNYFSFKVVGTSIPGFSYTFSYGNGEQYTTESNASYYQPGDQYSANLGFSTKTCGPRNVKITLNSDKKIPEKDYTNNSFEKVINVDCNTAPYNFDLSIQKVGTWPTTSTQGKSVSLGAKFFNLGTEEDPRLAGLYFGYHKEPNQPGHGPVCLYRKDSTGLHQISCPTGMYINDTFNVQDKPICGDNHYTLKVDGYNDLLETNENNNEVSGDVYVDCGQKPDFVIEKVGTWPTTVKSGTKPSLYFKEKNIGQGVANAGVVRMMVNGQYRAGYWPFQSLSFDSSTSPILFGYQQFTYPDDGNNYWIPKCNKGDKINIKICADNACGWGSSEIQESNENNNILTEELTCE